MAVHLSTVWERQKHKWRQELTLRASLSKATVKTLIDQGVSRATLDEPWISMKDDNSGFGIGRKICSQMMARNKALFIRTEMANFSCTNTRKEIHRKRQLSQQHNKSVL